MIEYTIKRWNLEGYIKEKRMKDVINDFKNGKFGERDEIADLQVYQLEGITFCLPINSSPKLRQYFAAAIKSYVHKADFEEVLLFEDIRNYDDKEWIDENLVVRFMIARSVDVLLNIINEFYNSLVEKEIEFSYGELAYFNTIARLRESFKSSIILCDRGFFIEIMPILRLIYEQLCWACYAIDETDNNKLNTNWKTKNTRFLKEKINPEYGRLYSVLSDEAHMALPEMGKYLEVDEKNKIICVNGRSAKKAKEHIPYIITLYKINLEVFEYGLKHFEYSDKEYFQELIDAQYYLIDMMKAILDGEKIDFSFIERI